MAVPDHDASPQGHDLTVEKRKLLAKRYTENTQAFLLCAKGLLYQARLYDQAIAECQQVIELDPTSFTIYDWLGAAYAQKGLYDREASANRLGAT